MATAPSDPSANAEEEVPVTHVVVTGNPIDGLIFYGTFADAGDAGAWAAANLPGADWWVAPVLDAD